MHSEQVTASVLLRLQRGKEYKSNTWRGGDLQVYSECINQVKEMNKLTCQIQ